VKLTELQAHLASILAERGDVELSGRILWDTRLGEHLVMTSELPLSDADEVTPLEEYTGMTPADIGL
jgi:hypothetical protein